MLVRGGGRWSRVAERVVKSVVVQVSTTVDGLCHNDDVAPQLLFVLSEDDSPVRSAARCVWQARSPCWFSTCQVDTAPVRSDALSRQAGETRKSGRDPLLVPG